MYAQQDKVGFSVSDFHIVNPQPALNGRKCRFVTGV